MGKPAEAHYYTTNCISGKRSYYTRSAAKMAAKNLAKKGLGNMRPYECPSCNTIHITHPKVRNGRR